MYEERSPQCHYTLTRLAAQAKRDLMVKILSDAGLRPTVPQGGYFILVDVSQIINAVDVGGDESEPMDCRFVKWLSRNKKLLGFPPSAFYSAGHKKLAEKFVRICFIKVFYH